MYERFLDPRHEGFNDPHRWDEVSTLGHTGRRYLSEDELYATYLEREPDAAPERRAELRTLAGRNARHNVAFFDATFSVQKSVTLLHTAFEAAGGQGPRRGRRGARRRRGRRSGGRWRTRSGRATTPGWPTWPRRRVLRGSGITAARPGGGPTRTTGWSQRSSSTTPGTGTRSCTSTTRSSTGCEGPDGSWRTIDGRSVFRWRPAAAAVAERTTEERLTDALGVLVATRPDGKAREVLGVAPEAMDLISSRRRALTGEGRGAGRGVRGPARPRPEQLGTGTAGPAGHPRDAGGEDRMTGESREQLLDRVDTQLRAEVAGGLAGVARAALAAREQAPAAQAWSPQAVIELALTDVQQRKAGWTRADLTQAINAALPDYLGAADGRDVAALLDQLTDEPSRTPGAWTPRTPATRSCPPGCDWPTAPRRIARLGPSCTPPRTRCAPNAPCSPPPPTPAPLRCRARRWRGSSGRWPRPGSSSAPTRPRPFAACLPPALGSSRWSAPPGRASRSWSARWPGLGRPTRPGGRTARTGVRARHVADRDRGAQRRGTVRAQRHPLAGHPRPAAGWARRRGRRRLAAAIR